jgi:hypothetical protein
MPTPEETKAMADIMKKLQAASDSDYVEQTPVAESKPVPAPANVSNDAVEMFNILNRLNEAQTKKEVVLESSTEKVSESYDSATISLNGEYNIQMEKQQVVPGVAKTFYNITDHNGEAIYEDIALFESAMLIVKGLLVGKVQIKTVLDLDKRYASHLAEAALYKQKAKRLNESARKDLALTKQGVAVDKMKMYKKRIKSMI